MSNTVAPWFRTKAPAKHDAPVRGKPTYPGLLDGDKKRKGRDNRDKRRAPPRTKPGGAPSYKPYDYPRPARVPRPVPEAPARPVSPKPFPTKPNLGRFRIPGGALGALGAGLGVLDLLDPLFFPNGDPNLPPRLPANYVWCNGPLPFPPVVPRPGGFGYWVSKPFFNGPGSCTIGLPLSGQTAAPVITYGQAFASSPAGVYWRRSYQHSATFVRDYVAGSVARVGVAINPQPAPHRAWNGFDGFDPNIERWLPTYPDPFAPVRPKPDFEVGFAQPLPGPEAFDNPDLPYQPDYQWQWELGVGVVAPNVPFVPLPVSPVHPPAVVPRIPPVKRTRPRKREKQRKVMTKSAKIGIALYKILDGISESAEVVDAFYDALPKEVRKRWEKERFPDARWIKDKNTGKWVRVGVERPGDNFGQYGIDGADWKLEALYYNWHKVDVEEAIKNIIKNELSDRVIGGIQAGLPKNSGAAHSQGEMELGQSLDDWFSSELGL